MGNTRRIIAAGIATAAFSLAAPSAFAASVPSPQVGYQPTYSCSIDSLTHVVTSIDWLRVHTAPGIGTPAVGQIPGGAAFHFCSSSIQTVGGLSWVQ
jgi:hypothetical protein